MPITELDKTAVAASEALGMSVTVYPEEADAIGIAGLPDQSPAEGTCPIFTVYEEVLVYLEGLTDGARIQRERHCPLVEAVQSAFRGTDTFNLDRIGALKRALAKLSD